MCLLFVWHEVIDSCWSLYVVHTEYAEKLSATVITPLSAFFEIGAKISESTLHKKETNAKSLRDAFIALRTCILFNLITTQQRKKQQNQRKNNKNITQLELFSTLDCELYRQNNVAILFTLQYI